MIFCVQSDETHISFKILFNKISNNINIAIQLLDISIKFIQINFQALPVVRWLIQQRNSLGGFSSTQDTVLALQVGKFAISAL